MNSSRDTVRACREAGKFVATPVSGPYSPHLKGNNRFTPGHGGQAVIDAWTEHVKSQPDMVIFTTWNDVSVRVTYSLVQRLSSLSSLSINVRTCVALTRCG